MHPPPAPGGLALIIRTFTFYLLVSLFPRELRGLVDSLPIKYHPNKYRPAGMKDRLALCLPESVQPHGPSAPSFLSHFPTLLSAPLPPPASVKDTGVRWRDSRTACLLVTSGHSDLRGGWHVSPVCGPVFVVEAGGWAPLAAFSWELSSKSTGLSAAIPDHHCVCPLSQTVEKVERVPLPLNEATLVRGDKQGDEL